MAIFVTYPWAAAFVAAAFGGLWALRPRRSSALAAAAWGVYCVYEYLMHARVLCSGECNIRVDLLLLYPGLALLSAFGLARTMRRR